MTMMEMEMTKFYKDTVAITTMCPVGHCMIPIAGTRRCRRKQSHNSVTVDCNGYTDTAELHCGNFSETQVAKQCSDA